MKTVTLHLVGGPADGLKCKVPKKVIAGKRAAIRWHHGAQDESTYIQDSPTTAVYQPHAVLFGETVLSLKSELP